MDIKFEPEHRISYKITLRSSKTQITLRIRTVLSQSSQSTIWVANDPTHL